MIVGSSESDSAVLVDSDDSDLECIMMSRVLVDSDECMYTAVVDSDECRMRTQAHIQRHVINDRDLKAAFQSS